MERKNMTFLIVGMIFGSVVGFFLSYALFFQKDTEFSTRERSSVQKQGIQQPQEHMNILEEIESLKRMLQENPSNYPALVRLGNLYFDAVKFDQAIGYYQKAIEIDDSDPNVMTDLGICFRNTGNPHKAIEYFEKAYSKDPSHWQSLYNILIVATSELNDYKIAQDALSRLEKVKPDARGLDFFRNKIDEMKKPS